MYYCTKQVSMLNGKKKNKRKKLREIITGFFIKLNVENNHLNVRGIASQSREEVRNVRSIENTNILKFERQLNIDYNAT